MPIEVSFAFVASVVSLFAISLGREFVREPALWIFCICRSYRLLSKTVESRVSGHIINELRGDQRKPLSRFYPEKNAYFSRESLLGNP